MGVGDEPDYVPSSPSLLSEEARRLYLDAVRSGGIPFAQTQGDSKAASALRELLHLGLLVPDIDDRSRCVAVDPQRLSARLSHMWQTKALELLVRSLSLSSELRDVVEAFHYPVQDGGAIEYVQGKVLINQRLDHLVAQSSEEILTAQPGGARPAEALARSYHRDLEVLHRGASMRTIYQPSARYSGPTREYVDAITRAGGQVRTLDESFTRLIVVDRRTAVIPVEGDLGVAAFIHDTAVVTFLVQEVFERDWDRAIAFDGSRSVPQRVVSRLRREIARLMLQGQGQRVIARRLGLSERTVARHLAEMREEYDADTLFQLGWRLAQVIPEVETESHAQPDGEGVD